MAGRPSNFSPPRRIGGGRVEVQRAVPQSRVPTERKAVPEDLRAAVKPGRSAGGPPRAFLPAPPTFVGAEFLGINGVRSVGERKQGMDAGGARSAGALGA